MIHDWWQHFEVVLGSRPAGGFLFMGGDANARLGSTSSTALGDLRPDFEDSAGQCFCRLCEKFQLILPSTFSQFHQGQSWTYMNPGGAQSRIDFVAIPADCVSGIVSSKVLDDIDLFHGMFDHHAVEVHLQLAIKPQRRRGFQRRISYDRQSARSVKHDASFDSFPTIAQCPWNLDLTAHWAVVRDQLQEQCRQVFPRPRRQQRQLFLTEPTWTILCHSKDVRIMIKQQMSAVQRFIALRLFRHWAQGRRNVSPHSRIPEHQARLQLALLTRVYQQVAARFRKQRNADWKAWITQQTSNVRHAFQHAPRAKLFQLLQPKKIVARAKGHFRRSLPTMRDCDNVLLIGRDKISMAWERRFAGIENAEVVSTQHLASQGPIKQRAREPSILREIPDLYQLEDALRTMSPHKAPGVDGIGAEILQRDICENAYAMYPLLLKGALRDDWISEWSGGWLLPLFKGKGSSHRIDTCRGILLEPVKGRIISRTWRSFYEKGLNHLASVMQYGGRKGLSVESLHLQARMWQSSSESAKVSLGILFIDIQAAFYSVIKPILTGFNGRVDELESLFHTLGLPPSAFPAFVKNVIAGSVVFDATGSRVCQSHARASLRSSWFIIPDGSRIHAPATGSRPGDPVADVLFAMTMARVLQTVEPFLDYDGVKKMLQLEEESLTWVDDVAMAIYAQADQLVSKTTALAGAVLDTMVEHGFRL